MYRSPNTVRVIKCRRRLIGVGHVTRVEEGRSAFKILAHKPTGNRHLGRPRRMWKDNIRMNPKEIIINIRIGLIQLSIGIIGDPL